MATPKPSGLVNYKIFIGGSELSGEFQLYSIDVIKEVNRIASATIKFIDGDTGNQKFDLSEKNNLEPGKEIEIKTGFDTEAISIFKGMIIKHSIKATQNGAFTIIEAKDKAIKLTIENRSEIYEKKKDSDIFKTLISRASGLSSNVSTTSYLHPQIIHYNCTDWDFLVSRAELNSMLVLNYDNKITIKKPSIGSPKLTLEYGTNIFEFEADINAVTQLSKVSATSWDIKNQKIIKNQISSADFTDTGSLKFNDLASKVKKDGYDLFHPGALEEGELKEWATSKMLKGRLSKLRGRVKCEGYANINPGDTIEIKGFSKKFNGNLYVSAVRHEITHGHWFTNIQFGISPNWHSEKFKISTPEASGLIPATHGLHIGKVKKITGDPSGNFRIQVALPVLGSKTNIWARMAFADAGKERGVYFIPEVDDEVILGFINEDARFPVILGTLYSANIKTPYTTTKDNNEKGIVTKSKMKLTFNDKDKVITIETPAKNKIEINDKNGTIVITDKSSNKVTMKSGLIELNSKGDIKLKAAKNVEISGVQIKLDGKTAVNVSAVNIKNEAKAQFKASGNAQAELSSTGQTSVKAAGIVQVQGALVKIN